ncbi:TetR/AcrR family transcriptional regulator [Actinomadura litoris]|uniref:TetR/AcrR family transcriptional regulator n=1 Tax=Actinomadura litoris TaxID=2678616 RepID=UPI001FA77F53|nr:TetR/AcrR family transcriptional regulator [Actinomadura litoris]
MATFQRARSQEQREVRRRSILATAAAMLGEMPVSAVSLNELSRRVGLAKSNVLRYFESREAILLALLAAQARDLLAELDDRLPARIDRTGTAATRAEALASGLAASFTSHEMLCELLGAQAGILEHNISTEAAVRCRRETREVLAGLAALAQRVLPELGDRRATEAAAMTLVLVAALWTHTRPAAAVRAAYDADPSLAVLVPSFTATLERSLTVFLTGLLSDPDPSGALGS